VCESRIEHRCYAVLVVVVDRSGGGFAEGDSGAHEGEEWVSRCYAGLIILDYQSI